MSAAVTRGKIKLNGVDPAHLGAFTKVMRDSGIFIEKILQAQKLYMFIHLHLGYLHLRLLPCPTQVFQLISRHRHVPLHVPFLD